MRVLLPFLAVLVAALAGPVEQSVPLDWSKITPINIYREPDGPAADLLKDAQVGGRIISGQQATRNGFPYQAALIMDTGGFCGGSLISQTWVLTAAHCTISARSVQVILGAHNVQQNEATQVVRNSVAIRNNAGWNSNTMQNDIALVQISAVAISTVVRTISLAAATSGDYANQIGTLTGWGRTSDQSQSISPTLQRINLAILANTACRSIWSNVIAQHICTSGSGGIGACNGDSGGPLVVNNVQVGIVSFGNRICSAGLPSVFARVSTFRAWIQQNSGV